MTYALFIVKETTKGEGGSNIPKNMITLFMNGVRSAHVRELLDIIIFLFFLFFCISEESVYETRTNVCIMRQVFRPWNQFLNYDMFL